MELRSSLRVAHVVRVVLLLVLATLFVLQLEVLQFSQSEETNELVTQLDYFHKHSIKEGIANITVDLAELQGPPWSDMDWSSGPRPLINDGKFPNNCGAQKCFYASHSNTSIGYVVGRGMQSYNKQLPILEFEQKLARISHSKPLLLNAPEILGNDLSRPFKKALSLYGTPLRDHDLWYFPTIKVPEPHLLIHTVYDMKDDIINFAPQITDKEEFRSNFYKAIENLAPLLTHPDTFLLRNDFQLLVDSTGHVYHVDLDRIDGVYRFADVEGITNGLERVIYWLTDANGNFSDLEKDVLFPAMKVCSLRCQARIKRQLVEELAASNSKEPI